MCRISILLSGRCCRCQREQFPYTVIKLFTGHWTPHSNIQAYAVFILRNPSYFTHLKYSYTPHSWQFAAIDRRNHKVRSNPQPQKLQLLTRNYISIRCSCWPYILHVTLNTMAVICVICCTIERSLHFNHRMQTQWISYDFHKRLSLFSWRALTE
jgi:hypothetical protein